MADGRTERVLGAVVIVLGTAIVGFSPRRWDRVIIHLPREHGIHAHDVLGLAVVLLGVALLWRAPRPR